MFRSATLFCVCFVTAHYGLNGVIPVVNSLSAPSIPQLPPSNNPDVLRAYVFGGDARCWEVLSPSVLPDPNESEEEDEVEYWYPTRKRYFEFSIPSSSVASSACTTIRQTSFGCGKLGYELWDSSIALCLYLGQESLAEGKRILELGSGCGLPSVVCRDDLSSKAILATDFWEKDNETFDGDRLVPTKFHGLNLEYNVCVNNKNNNKNNADRVEVESFVQCLDWHDRDSAANARDTFRPDLVIASDVVYYPMDVEPLLNVLEILLVGDGDVDDKGHTRAVLVLPLAPAEREALPEFRSKLPARFSESHTIKMEERDLVREDTDDENTSHLIIDMIPKQKS